LGLALVLSHSRNGSVGAGSLSDSVPEYQHSKYSFVASPNFARPLRTKVRKRLRKVSSVQPEATGSPVTLIIFSYQIKLKS
jgi:hypothetical protein